MFAPAAFCWTSDGFLLFLTRQEGVVRFYVGIRVCDASTPRPHPESRQSCSPVDPAQYPAERLASGSRRVSRQSGSPVDPAEYPAEYPLPVDPAEYPARAARQWIPPSIPLSIPCWWIVPSIRPVSGRSGSPLFASGSRQCPQSSSPVWFCLMSRPAHSGAAFMF